MDELILPGVCLDFSKIEKVSGALFGLKKVLFKEAFWWLYGILLALKSSEQNFSSLSAELCINVPYRILFSDGPVDLSQRLKSKEYLKLTSELLSG